jgi:aspartate carbamoyltransferase catalytic subunit
VICGPPTLLPSGLSCSSGNGGAKGGSTKLPQIEVEHDLDRALIDADVVMALRLQTERQQGGLLPSIREYVNLYQLNARRLALAKPNALVMHPGPMNEGVEITPEVAHCAQSVIEEQVNNGVAVRMALLYLLAGARS